MTGSQPARGFFVSRTPGVWFASASCAVSSRTWYASWSAMFEFSSVDALAGDRHAIHFPHFGAGSEYLPTGPFLF